MIHTIQINDFELTLKQTRKEETKKRLFELTPQLIPAKYEIKIIHSDPEIMTILYEKLKELLK